MTKPSLSIAFALLVAFALPAQAFVSFGDARFMFPDTDLNTRDDHAISLANDGAGNWVSATDGPYVSVSSDNGDTWTTPVLLAGGDGFNGENLYTDPMVVTDKAGTWILAEYHSAGPKINVWRSTDNGATWSAPVDLVAAATTSGESRPRIATDGAGNWMAVWSALNPVNGDLDTAFSTSSDNGMTWSPPGWVNPDAMADTVEEYYPSVATDGAGNWVVVTAWFGSAFDGDTWIVKAYRSTNFGGLWSNGVDVSSHIGLAWTDIVSSGPGVFVTFHTKVAAIVCRSADGGATWDQSTISGAYPSANAHPGHLDTDGNGEWIAIWDTDNDPTNQTGTDIEMVYSKSTDDGLTWSPPKYVDLLDAITDDQNDSMPAVASDGASRWIAAWQRPGGPSLDIIMSISDKLCPDVRRVDCITGESGKSQFQISNPSGTDKDKIKFKVNKAGLTTLADFGDPTASDDLLLCVWDATAGVDALEWREVLPAGVTCGGEPCWKASSSGYGFKDKETENSPYTKAKLKAGEAGKAQVAAQLGGTLLELPELPFTSGPSIAVQLISDQSGKCWGASFSTFKSNESGKYSAKSD